MKRAILLVTLTIVAFPAAAQTTPIAPTSSVLFQSARAQPTDSAQGVRSFSWPRATVGAAFGATVAVALVSLIPGNENCSDCTSEPSHPYALVMIPAAILGFLIAGKTGARE